MFSQIALKLPLHSFTKAVTLLSVFGLMSACSGSQSLNSSNEVKDIDVTPRQSLIGDRLRVSVRFTTEENFVGEAEDVDVAIRMPAGFSYIEGSGELSAVHTSSERFREPLRILNCTDYSVVLFSFAKSDLRRFDFASEFLIDFQVRSSLRAARALFRADAQERITYTCGEEFLYEEEEVVEVL